LRAGAAAAQIARSARKSFAHAPRVIRGAAVFYVYVLRSETDSGLYIGYTRNLRARVKQHNSTNSFATAHRSPLKLIYYEAYLNQADALGRERYLKSGAGRRFLKVQLQHYLRNNPIRSVTRTGKI
jgi:putative endonuclease